MTIKNEEINQKELEQRIVELIPSLQRRSLALTKDKEESEDLFQETFAKIWTYKHKYVYDESLRAWCYKIMYNAYIDMYKKNKRSVRLAESYDDTDEMSYSTRNFDQLKDYNTVITDITLTDIYDTIKEELSTIDVTIVTKVLEGYKHQEIADELKLQRNNVKQHYFQAIRKVRLALITKFNLDEEYVTRLLTKNNNDNA